MLTPPQMDYVRLWRKTDIQNETQPRDRRTAPNHGARLIVAGGVAFILGCKADHASDLI
jgi:hypothetical protein